MPRAKKPQLGEQVYNLPRYGPLAKVTITYDVNNPPPFFQPAPNVAIVGDHICAVGDGARPSQQFTPEISFRQGPNTRYVVPRGGNFKVDPDDPAYLAFKAGLPGGGGAEPAPPDYSPPVITNADINAEFEQRTKAQIKSETGLNVDVTVPDVGNVVAIGGG